MSQPASAPAADTIAAVATGPAPGGIGIVRLSGPASLEIGAAICGIRPAPRRVYHCPFTAASGELLDHGIVLFFQGPASYTGEDVLELQGHGGSVAPQRVLARVLELGARLARPGEFTERAFLNGKLDLTQAEAVADLIASSNEASARAAVNSLQGRFSELASQLAADILQARMYFEAHIDFPEEELQTEGTGGIRTSIQSLITRLEEVRAQASRGRNLVEGTTVVLAGPPNAGKSSLLNALSGMDSAIVTDVPGTTRDVLRESVLLDGVPITLLDTAGLRETVDPIEQEGVRRSESLLARADHVLVVVDVLNPGQLRQTLATLPETAAPRTTLVWNKADLLAGDSPRSPVTEWPAVWVSARTGEGLENLRARLRNCVTGAAPADHVFSARARHVEALDAALQCLQNAAQAAAAGAGLEMVSEDLRVAHDQLGRITGTVTSDDLLGEIFAGFCIGK